MKKFVALAAVSAAALIATPAAAQKAAGPVGPRVEALVGWDHVRVSLDDFGVDESESDNGVLFGIGAGYDFGMFGVDVEATESTVKEGDDETGSVKLGRDLYVGGRLNFAVSEAALVYVKAGYTNARVKAEFGDESESANGDGVRAGVGTQFRVGGKGYVGGEYRYSNYESDVTRHQLALILGTRF